MIIQFRTSHPGVKNNRNVINLVTFYCHQYKPLGQSAQTLPYQPLKIKNTASLVFTRRSAC
jgi:hypothetical protein